MKYMGTSSSSNGPGSGVSLDPPWLEDIEIPNIIKQPSSDKTEIPLILAPKSRFGNARRNMGEYVRSGSRDSLRKALGHYSKSGMGGARQLSQRMRTSTKVAANFVNTFRSLRDDESFELRKVLLELKDKNASARKVINTIIEAVCPNGGSLDEQSSQDSGTVALSEFMDENPDADICNLTDDQIWFLAGMYLSNETFSRIQVDIGQWFEKQEISDGERVDRANDMREFIQSDISAQINKLRNSENQTMSFQRLFQETIKNTFEVYEVEI